MLDKSISEVSAFNRGVYNAAEGLRLLNFTRNPVANVKHISRQTVSRWLRGYDHGQEPAHHSEPLWRPDYENDDGQIELSFRDLIELRFVKAFRDLGLSLPTIRECFKRAADEVQDDRPFSTQRVRTDEKTIFLEITDKLKGKVTGTSRLELSADLRTLTLTERLRQAGTLLGIKVLDHVIVGHEGHFSFLDAGLLE